MTRLILIVICTIFSCCSYGQELSELFSVHVQDNKTDNHTFFLVTNDGNIKIDSADLKVILPEWIKSINIVKRSNDSVNRDHVNSSLLTPSVFIELKKKYLKKYINSR